MRSFFRSSFERPRAAAEQLVRQARSGCERLFAQTSRWHRRLAFAGALVGAMCSFADRASAAEVADSYVIQPGDTLSEIATQQRVSVAELQAANPHVTNPDRIVAGHHLILPAMPSAAVQAASAPPHAALVASLSPEPPLPSPAPRPVVEVSTDGAVAPDVRRTSQVVPPPISPEAQTEMRSHITTEQLLTQMASEVAALERVVHRGQPCTVLGCTADGGGIILQLHNRAKTQFAITNPESLQRFAAENGVQFGQKSDTLSRFQTQKSNTKSMARMHTSHVDSSISPQRMVFNTRGPSESGASAPAVAAEVSVDSKETVEAHTVAATADVKRDIVEQNAERSGFENLKGPAKVTLKNVGLNVRVGVDPCTPGGTRVDRSVGEGSTFTIVDAMTFKHEQGTRHVWGKTDKGEWIALGIVGGKMNVDIANVKGVAEGDKNEAEFNCVPEQEVQPAALTVARQPVVAPTPDLGATKGWSPDVTTKPSGEVCDGELLTSVGAINLAEAMQNNEAKESHEVLSEVEQRVFREVGNKMIELYAAARAGGQEVAKISDFKAAAIDAATIELVAGGASKEEISTAVMKLKKKKVVLVELSEASQRRDDAISQALGFEGPTDFKRAYGKNGAPLFAVKFNSGGLGVFRPDEYGTSAGLGPADGVFAHRVTEGGQTYETGLTLIFADEGEQFTFNVNGYQTVGSSEVESRKFSADELEWNNKMLDNTMSGIDRGVYDSIVDNSAPGAKSAEKQGMVSIVAGNCNELIPVPVRTPIVPSGGDGAADGPSPAGPSAGTGPGAEAGGGNA